MRQVIIFFFFKMDLFITLKKAADAPHFKSNSSIEQNKHLMCVHIRRKSSVFLQLSWPAT